MEQGEIGWLKTFLDIATNFMTKSSDGLENKLFIHAY